MKLNLLVLTLTAGIANAQCPGGYGPGGPGGPGPGGPPPVTIPSPPTGGGRPIGGPITPGPGPVATPTGGGSAPAPTRATPATGARATLPIPPARAPASPPGPTTGPRGLAAAAAVPATGRRGTPMVIARGATSWDRLDPDWDYPIAAVDRDQQTASRGSLTTEAVFETLAEGDSRPLLIVREAADGQASALLEEYTGDDRARLLATWFHCVKLPPNTLDENHPFKNAVADAARVVVCLADGSQARRYTDGLRADDLIDGMRGVLSAAYPGDADRAASSMLQLLDQFDRLDADETRVKAALEDTLEKSGERARRVTELRAELVELAARRKVLLQQEARIVDLGSARATGD